VSYGKKWNHILAVVGSGRATDDYGLIGINHDDRGTRDDRAACIRDSAQDRGSDFLTYSVVPEESNSAPDNANFTRMTAPSVFALNGPYTNSEKVLDSHFLS
jgi:hypothetical protein